MEVTANKSESVAILLCTFHGERYLIDQLNSFDEQTHQDWRLYVSDDSNDHLTHDILRRFQQGRSKDKVAIRRGPLKGFATNFLTLVCDKTISADYYAFSDQDDRWECDKLARAIAWLRTIPDDMPAFYCSRTQLINAAGEKTALSFYFKKQPSFANALVQNIAGGNTIVFNNAARKLLLRAGMVDVSAHDLWVYLVVTACGGKINYDKHPSIHYRQHENNVIGLKTGFIARFKSFHMLIKGRFRNNNDKYIAALSKIYPYMTESNQVTLNKFIDARNHSVIKRLFYLYRSGIYRQTLAGNVALAVAALLNRI